MKVWKWLKKHWKSIMLLGIPVIISWFLGERRTVKSQEEALKLKDEELELQRDILALADELDAQARKERDTDLHLISHDFNRRMARIEEEKRNKIESIDSAEDATNAIKDALK